MIAAGFGFSSRASAGEFAAALDEALRVTGIGADRIGALATLDDKAETGAFRHFAETHAIAIAPVGHGLAAAFSASCATASARSETETGLPSVAECTALATVASAGGSSEPKLLLARIVSGHVTCALAGSASADEIAHGRSEAEGHAS
ncbi:hypothetical protein B7H23_10170 [Notoacmeibacter marinus]|uniref:CobE/GbiG C-terminal domain-containing protein n=1 Tax=Notoacmeibacter marinus TaxID=1876515 RepID=A0A231UX16_9HYPH|nr:cobalamin biosynthesis protein [Notoacmeibacter marinus]OXT00478.1 hypothetical protein B7H23_10170 [Notoacmeibacter marinus]